MHEASSTQSGQAVGTESFRAHSKDESCAERKMGQQQLQVRLFYYRCFYSYMNSLPLLSNYAQTGEFWMN